MCERCTVEEVIRALMSRSGFDGWWEGISPDVQDEIKEELLDIIEW